MKNNIYQLAVSYGQPSQIETDTNTDNLDVTIMNIVNWIVGLLGIVAVIVIIIGGVQYMTSSGDPGKVKKAKDTLLYGIIGLIVVILAAAIVNFVIGGILNQNNP